MSDHTANFASYSSLSLHRTCPQAWAYRYVEGLQADRPDDLESERLLGIWWHYLRAADAARRGTAAHTLRHLPDTFQTPGGSVTSADVLGNDRDFDRSLVEKWFDGLSLSLRQEWLEVLGTHPLKLLALMDRRWQDMWAERTKHEQVLGVEIKWRRKLPTMTLPDGTLVDTETTLGGYVDEVVHDTQRNLTLVRDHKTSKDITTRTVLDDLMDSQLQNYAWGVSPLVTEWGFKLKAVEYDRIRAVWPKTPQLTLAGALGKSVTDYDEYTYEEWARESPVWGTEGEFYKTGAKKGQPKFGTYVLDPKVLENLQTPAARSKWANRNTSPVNLNIVRAHLTSAVDTAADVNRTRERFAAAGQAARNFGNPCRWCDFRDLCNAQMIGGPEGDYELAEHGLRRRKEK